MGDWYEELQPTLVTEINNELIGTIIGVVCMYILHERGSELRYGQG